MKGFFKKTCVPLMLISNNVYTFLSGVIISLAINIFSTLCIEKIDISSGWHLYVSFVLYLISGALFIYIATKVTTYQNYIASKQVIDSKEKAQIIMDFEETNACKWIIVFAFLIITTLGGCALLAINYIL